MFLYLYLDKNNVVKKYSAHAINTNRYRMVKAEVDDPKLLVGTTYEQGSSIVIEKGFRVAVISNFNDQCGIATYSKYLVDSLIPRVDAVKIFAETNDNPPIDGYDIEYTWQRGKSMLGTIKKVEDWQPSVVLVQHEFGLFPNAKNFLPMLQALSKIPYVLTLHSVYEHRDKSVCTANIKNIVVHSESGKQCLKKLGNLNRIEVIPHGCVSFGAVKPNWNIIGTPHSIMQFGFGFNYKGVDVALRAMRQLIDSYPTKYKDLFYCYYCSENPHCINTNTKYYNELVDLVQNLELQNNVSILRGFLSDSQLNEALRTYKLAIFPYVTDRNNVVYGASGAAKIAMANNVPTIVSSSNMFDDLEGVLERPNGPVELAEAIDKVFSDKSYREAKLIKQMKYIESNSWDNTADRYLQLLKQIANG